MMMGVCTKERKGVTASVMMMMMMFITIIASVYYNVLYSFLNTAKFQHV